MNRDFQEYVEKLPGLFDKLITAPMGPVRALANYKNVPCIYIFYEGENAVHVGRTRNLQGRLRGHTLKSHFSASFAFKRARRELGTKATYTQVGSRADLARDPIFGPEFHRQVELVKAMKIRYLVEKRPVLQYLLELYAAVELSLPLDEFDTH